MRLLAFYLVASGSFLLGWLLCACTRVGRV